MDEANSNGETLERSTDELKSSRGEPQSGLYAPLRIWPPILLLVAMVIARLVPAFFEDPPTMIWMVPSFTPAALGLVIMIWWLAASRARWNERLIGLVGVVIIAVATGALSHKTMLGPATTVITIPVGLASFALGAICCRNVLSFRRTVLALLVAAVGFGSTTLLRNDGVWGDFTPALSFRFSPTSEDQVIASRRDQQAFKIEQLGKGVDRAILNPEWPGFRGPYRDGRQLGQFASNWDQQPPELIWKIKVGSGWSSFAVAGEMLFTQEQRGAYETIVCYHAATGNEIWTYGVESRFDDPLGGPGPRATPTLHGGSLYVLCAQGELVCLDPKTGDLVWRQRLKEVAEVAAPMWGFCSSPAVYKNRVMVYTGALGDKGVMAFDCFSGDFKWSVASGEHSYSSPHLARLAGKTVMLMLSNFGINIVDPISGEVLLDYSWKSQGYRALQPVVLDTESLLLPTGNGYGTRRIKIAANENDWSAEEVWTTRRFKGDFNDMVVHKGHAYGYDGAVLACIDLETGKRRWKRGRYGKGQVLLLEDSELILVVTEKGELVLVQADPERHRELARFQGIEGRTWNHPVVVGERLFLRNAQEAACYRLPMNGARALQASTTDTEADASE